MSKVRYGVAAALALTLLSVVGCGGASEASDSVSEVASSTERDIATSFRSAPAPDPNEFISDPPEFVGMTGRPQLVEFFTDW